MSYAGLLDKLQQLAAKRNQEDVTIGPVITWTTDAMLEHAKKLQQIPGQLDTSTPAMEAMLCKLCMNGDQGTVLLPA